MAEMTAICAGGTYKLESVYGCKRRIKGKFMHSGEAEMEAGSQVVAMMGPLSSGICTVATIFKPYGATEPTSAWTSLA